MVLPGCQVLTIKDFPVSKKPDAVRGIEHFGSVCQDMRELTLPQDSFNKLF